jgi:methylase of polypeptide subunit release factors
VRACVRALVCSSALDGGEDGLAVIRVIASRASQWLAPLATSRLMLEMDASHGVAVQHVARPGLQRPQVVQDIAGRDRFAVFERQ